jgi:mRNA degradation ribonuclease J1/J2
MKRALLVIDVQNEYFTGKLPVSYPHGNLEQIAQAMDTADEANIPVVLIQHSVEFLSDATGTLAFKNSAGEVSAEELHRAILVTQQIRFSNVLSTEEWTARVRGE